MTSFGSDLFDPFWTVIHAHASIATNVAISNGVAVRKLRLHNNVQWPGEDGLDELLVRPIYDRAFTDIQNGILNNPKFYYLIEGSSGMGKTDFIGFLIESLVRLGVVPLPTFRIHFSKESDIEPDIWLHYDVTNNNAPIVTRSTTSPLPMNALPHVFVSDTYAISSTMMSSRLHLHVGSVGSKDEKYERWCMNRRTHGNIVFPPFSRSEHIWCMGQWRDITSYIRLLCLHKRIAFARAVRRLGPRPHPRAAHAFQRYQNNLAEISHMMKLRYINIRGGALNACAEAGGNTKSGVWVNWEELQFTYDVFGGCMRLLRLPHAMSAFSEPLALAKQRINEFFADVQTVSGERVTDRFSNIIHRCGRTIVLAVNELKNNQRENVSRAILEGKTRSLFQHIVWRNDELDYVPASKFMTTYVALTQKEVSGDFQKLIMGVCDRSI